jgi:DNA-binding NtrC family response regulator
MKPLTEREKARVLIVDDEIYIQEILSATLQEAGYQCICAGTADVALAALATHRFDIAFMDIRMPGKSGTQLLSEMRPMYPDIVVIMVTALDSAGTAIDTIRA